MSAARSAGPMNTPSTPSVAAISSSAASAGTAFDLQQQADFVIGGRQIVGNAVECRGPGERRADAAHAVRRISHGAHHGLRLLAGLDHRHQQRLRADIEHLLDDPGLADRRRG